MSEKRRDNKNRILHNGESQRKDGRYMFKYTDAQGNSKYLYSWRLNHNDPTPAGKKRELSLRELEKKLEQDIFSGLVPGGGDITVLELVEKYVSLKSGVRHNTEANYKFVINIIKKEPLLILDDLGSERNSGYVVENVFAVLDRRVCSGKPMIITTNLTVKEMRETQNLDYKRIYDRVLGSCQPICIKGVSHRREKGNQNKRAFEQIFHEEESE